MNSSITNAALASVYNVAAAASMVPRIVATPTNAAALWDGVSAYRISACIAKYVATADTLYSDTEVESAFAAMIRSPSTSIKPCKPQGILPPVGARRAAFAAVFNAGRAAFPQVDGLTCIDASRAYFQVVGDVTFYSVTISADECAALGYMS